MQLSTFNTASGIANNQIANFNAAIEDYGSFAGTDILAFVNHVPVGTIMGISYTIHSEKQAQYTFGDRNVRRFTSGKRGIAGTLVFNTFDRNALLAIFAGSNLIGEPMANIASLAAQNPAGNPFAGRYGELGNSIPAFNPLGNATFDTISSSFNTVANGDTQQFTSDIQSDLQNAYSNAFWVPLTYADQLPPFDVTLTMADSQGHAAYMVIGGVEIMNEGGGFTVDDLTNQTAYTYVAKYIRPLTPVTQNGNSSASVPLVPQTGIS